MNPTDGHHWFACVLLQSLFQARIASVFEDPSNDKLLLELFAELQAFDSVCDRLELELVCLRAPA